MKHDNLKVCMHCVQHLSCELPRISKTLVVGRIHIINSELVLVISYDLRGNTKRKEKKNYLMMILHLIPEFFNCKTLVTLLETIEMLNQRF